jgi:hypothetical protein
MIYTGHRDTAFCSLIAGEVMETNPGPGVRTEIPAPEPGALMCLSLNGDLPKSTCIEPGCFRDKIPPIVLL